MRKCDERDIPSSTWNKIAEEEPVFILRAQDRLAPVLVRIWAELAVLHAETDTVDAKVKEAQVLARVMDIWQGLHGCKWPD